MQGGINDVVQGRPVEEAAAQPRGHGRARAASSGSRVALVDVLPWNNGDGRAAARHRALNELIRAIAEGLGVPLLPFHDTLVDPDGRDRMRDEWTDDGDHPSIEGHRLLGERAFSPSRIAQGFEALAELCVRVRILAPACCARTSARASRSSRDACSPRTSRAC